MDTNPQCAAMFFFAQQRNISAESSQAPRRPFYVTHNKRQHYVRMQYLKNGNPWYDIITCGNLKRGTPFMSIHDLFIKRREF